MTFPPRQGLYDPEFERDACGLGFVATLGRVGSHEVIAQGLEILQNLTHRGGRHLELASQGVYIDPVARSKRVLHDQRGDRLVDVVAEGGPTQARDGCRVGHVYIL